MTNLKQLVLATALAVSIAGVASGATAVGTVAFHFGGLSPSDPGALAPTTTFTSGAPDIDADGTDDFSCLGANPVCTGDPLAFGGAFTGNGLVGVTFSFGPALRYQYTVGIQGAVAIAHPFANLTLYGVGTTGTLVDTGGFFDSGPASLIIGLTEACVQGVCSIQGGATFQTPPGFNIPEPGTLALFGSALIGVAALRLRKDRKGR